MTTPMRGRGESGWFARASIASKLPAPAASHSRRVQFISSPHSESFEFPVPWRPIRPDQHPGRFGIADDLFPLGVPAQTTAEPKRNVGQVADRGHPMGAFEVGDRL